MNNSLTLILILAEELAITGIAVFLTNKTMKLIGMKVIHLYIVVSRKNKLTKSILTSNSDSFILIDLDLF